MPTDPTPYAEVNELLERLCAAVQTALGPKLVGIYLYGSLVTGDFDPESSDIDLLVAKAADLDERELAALHQMHQGFAAAYPRWDDRIEVAYLSVTGLKTFRTQRSTIAIISPGEPFHVKDAGSDWLMNWYIVREKGRALAGPTPQTLIDPIAKEEWLEAVQAHAQEWRAWIEHTALRKGQAYAILTLCRAIYALTTGELASKKQAALWVAQVWPEWAALVQQALAWRAAWRDEGIDHAATLPQTRQFVQFIVDRCAEIPGICREVDDPNTLKHSSRNASA